MRVLLPTDVDADASARSLLEAVRSGDFEAGTAVPGAESLRPSPPLWSEQDQSFQLAFEGRARCDSCKNTQLLSDRFSSLPTVQVGKLRKNIFNVDLAGHISPYQAFAVAIAIFDQSRHWMKN